MNDLNIYIDSQVSEIKRIINLDDYILYEHLYKSIKGQNLIELLARVQSGFNDLFKFLNLKYNSLSGGGHYNADESRQLKNLINFYKKMKVNLYKLSLEIEIEKEYAKAIEVCESFLSSSGGSKIPLDFNKVTIIESIPIFYFKDMISVESEGGKNN